MIFLNSVLHSPYPFLTKVIDSFSSLSLTTNGTKVNDISLRSARIHYSTSLNTVTGALIIAIAIKNHSFLFNKYTSDG